MGGALHHEGDAARRLPGYDWAQAGTTKASAMDNVRVLTRTTAFGYHAQNFVGLLERVTEHLPAPDPDRCRASGCGRCAPSR
jgi:sarcosine oxidase subunit alpha